MPALFLNCIWDKSSFLDEAYQRIYNVFAKMTKSDYF